MKVDVLLGLQWGDEGKGKVVDVLTPKYDVIARFQGGPLCARCEATWRRAVLAERGPKITESLSPNEMALDIVDARINQSERCAATENGSCAGLGLERRGDHSAKERRKIHDGPRG